MEKKYGETLQTATLGRTELEVTHWGYGAMEIRTEFAGNEGQHKRALEWLSGVVWHR